MIPSIKDRQNELDRAIQKSRQGGALAQAPLKRLLIKNSDGSRSIPFWVSTEQQESLQESLGRNVVRKTFVSGEALGVLAFDKRGQSRIVKVRVEFVTGERDKETVHPSMMSGETWDGVLRAADLAIRLYPYYTPISAMSDLWISVTDVDGGDLKLDETITGVSLGAAVLVATWSLLMGQVIQEGLVFTGAIGHRELIAAAPVLGVARIRDKSLEVAAAQMCFVIPDEPGSDGQKPVEKGRFHTVKTIEELLVTGFAMNWVELLSSCLRPESFDPTLALEIEDRRYRMNGDGLRWIDLASRFQAIASSPELHPTLRPLAHARAGACFSHMNEQRQAEKELTWALDEVEHFSPNQISGQIEVITRTHLAVALQDRFQLDKAAEMAESAARLAEKLRLLADGINAWSTLGQIRRAQRRYEESLELAIKARDFYDDRHSSDCPRNHTYVIATLARLGRLDGVESEYRLGIEHNLTRTEFSRRQFNRAFLDYARLTGWLYALRRGSGSVGWDKLLKEADYALDGLPPSVWPAQGLIRIRNSAQIRFSTQENQDSIVSDAIRAGTDDSAAGRYLFAWQSAMIVIEAALVSVERKVHEEYYKIWLDEAFKLIPPNSESIFSSIITNIRKSETYSECFRHLLKLLEADPY